MTIARQIAPQTDMLMLASRYRTEALLFSGLKSWFLFVTAERRARRHTRRHKRRDTHSRQSHTRAAQTTAEADSDGVTQTACNALHNDDSGNASQAQNITNVTACYMPDVTPPPPSSGRVTLNHAQRRKSANTRAAQKAARVAQTADILRRNPAASLSQIADIVGVSRETVRRYKLELREASQ